MYKPALCRRPNNYAARILLHRGNYVHEAIRRHRLRLLLPIVHFLLSTTRPGFGPKFLMNLLN